MLRKQQLSFVLCDLRMACLFWVLLCTSFWKLPVTPLIGKAHPAAQSEFETCDSSQGEYGDKIISHSQYTSILIKTYPPCDDDIGSPASPDTHSWHLHQSCWQRHFLRASARLFFSLPGGALKQKHSCGLWQPSGSAAQLCPFTARIC